MVRKKYFTEEERHKASLEWHRNYFYNKLHNDEEFHEKHKARLRESYNKNKEKYLEAKVKYYQKNKEEIKEKRKERYYKTKK